MPSKTANSGARSTPDTAWWVHHGPPTMIAGAGDIDGDGVPSNFSLDYGSDQQNQLLRAPGIVTVTTEPGVT